MSPIVKPEDVFIRVLGTRKRDTDEDHVSHQVGWFLLDWSWSIVLGIVSGRDSADEIDASMGAFVRRMDSV